MSILDPIPQYKSLCCMKYTVENQCKRCPFRQIESPEDQEKAMNECRERRRGTYTYDDKEIEYNNQYR